MTIVQNSHLAQWLIALWALFQQWSDSSALCCFLSALRRTAQGSAVCRFLGREGVLLRTWEHSAVCRLCCAALNLPCALVRRVCRKDGVLSRSAFFRVLCGPEDAPAILLGLFILVMLVTPHSVWNNLYGLLGALGAALLFILGAAVRPERRLDAATPGPYLLIYGMCLCGGLVFSLSPSLSLRFFLFHVCALLIVLLTVSSINSYRQLRLCAALAVAGISIAAVYGCYQGIIGVEAVPSQWDPALNPDELGRVYSFFDNPNNFAELLAMLIPLNVALLLDTRERRPRLACLASLAVCAGAIGLTYSRSSWIGLTVAFLVFLGLTNWRLVPVLLVAGLLAIPLLPSSIYDRILTIGNMKDSSTLYRLYIYEAAYNLWQDFWAKGVGLGSDVLGDAFRYYPSMYVGIYPIHTHNNYLQLWCELGITGFLSYLALLLGGLKSGVRQFRRTTDRRLRHMLAAAIGAFCGILVISVAEYTWYYPRNMFVYWFLFGIILACIKLSRKSAAPQAQ